MEELAKDLQYVLKGFDGCKVDSDDDSLTVYPAENIATPLFAECIYEFALVNSLSYYIGVSVLGRLNFVLYKD